MSIIRNKIRFRTIRSNVFIACLIFLTFLSFISYRKSIKDSEKQISVRDRLHLDIESDLDQLESNKAKIKELLETNNLDNYKLILPHMRKLKPLSDKYLILEYTNVFFKPKFCNKNSEEIFNSELETCEYSNCEYTCDKTTYLSQADALLFHQRDLEAEFEKSKKKFEDWFNLTSQFPFKTIEQKLKNNPDQIWILWNDEATSIDKNFNKISHFFNWTLSYRTNAEVFEGSYGFFKENMHLTETEILNHNKKIVENFKVRKNAILWFVSNCESKSREKIALEISRYYPVHIYGRCDLSDHMNEQDIKIHYPFLKVYGDFCERGSQCEEEKFRSYKYYLAFENRNCSDYVTEKVWKALNRIMIPIVFQPSRDSYQRYSIPSKSIIHLEDFSNNAKNLTDNLRKIDSNFDLYTEYIKWTLMYLKTFDEAKYTEPHRMCQLCKQLNIKEERISYQNISDFFNENCKINK